MYGRAPYGTTPYGRAPYGVIQPSWGLRLEVVPLTLQPSWGLKLRVWGTVQPSWGLRLQVVDVAAMLAGAAHGWGYRATVGGTDVSSRLIGPMEAGGEEGLAATARFSLRPAAGPVDPAAYVGRDVLLEYVWLPDDGSYQQVVPLFVGRVDTVDIDAASFALTLTAVDNRGDVLVAGGADLLPGSRWSAGVFQEDATPLQQQEDRLSTLCAAFDLGPDGSPALTPWAAKPTPDWTVGGADYVWGSLRLKLATQADLVQRVVAEFDYRFSRLRLRETRAVYDFGGATQLLADPIAPPSVAMIEEAITNSGLTKLEDVQYMRMDHEWYNLGGQWHQYPGFEGMAVMFRAWLGRRWAQSVDEHYTLTLDCADAGVDARAQRDIRGALAATFDAAAWEEDANAAPVLARPYLSIETLHDATDDAATGRAQAGNAIETLLAQGQRILRASHRQNRVTFDTRLNPLITRSHTVRFTAGGVDCRGKVFAVRHSLDPAARDGALGAKTTVTLAISRPSLPAPTPSALTAPAAPAITTAVAQAHLLILGNHIGAKSTSPAWDAATMQGYIVNIPSGTRVDGMLTQWGYGGMWAHGEVLGDIEVAINNPYRVDSTYKGASYYAGEIPDPNYVAANAYPWQFRLISPEVEPAARDNLDEPLAAAYKVDVPADLFTLTAP